MRKFQGLVDSLRLGKDWTSIYWRSAQLVCAAAFVDMYSCDGV